MHTEQPEREVLQAEVDADEHDVEERYARWQGFMELIADAARRSDAMLRLERALGLATTV